MAVDTAGKRASVLHMHPIPSGSIDAGDRIQVLWWYRGITVTAPSVVTAIVIQFTSEALTDPLVQFSSEALTDPLVQFASEAIV